MSKHWMAVATRILLPAALAWSPLVTSAQTDAERALLDMRQAFQAGNAQRLSALLPRTQGHLLEPQAAYWELRARLNTASPQEIRAFLQRHAGSYHEGSVGGVRRGA